MHKSSRRSKFGELFANAAARKHVIDPAANKPYIRLPRTAVLGTERYVEIINYACDPVGHENQLV